MKRKSTLIITSIAVGVALLFTTAFAGASGTSGYETYKEAVKNMTSVKNVTVTGNVSLSDNGKELLSAKGEAKVNKDLKTMSGKVETSGIGVPAITMESYRTGDKTITKTNGSDVYNVMVDGNKMLEKHKNIAEKDMNIGMQKDVEKVIDAAVGNIQNYISADGNTVSLNMSGDQINPTANAVASLMVKAMENPGMLKGNRDIMAGDAGMKLTDNMKAEFTSVLPKLSEDIRISSIKLDATISNKLIQKQTAIITITGKDASGKDESVVINATMNLSNYNNTTPDTIDLTGKNVKEINLSDEMNKMREIRK